MSGGKVAYQGRQHIRGTGSVPKETGQLNEKHIKDTL